MLADLEKTRLEAAPRAIEILAHMEGAAILADQR